MNLDPTTLNASQRQIPSTTARSPKNVEKNSAEHIHAPSPQFNRERFSKNLSSVVTDKFRLLKKQFSPREEKGGSQIILSKRQKRGSQVSPPFCPEEEGKKESLPQKDPEISPRKQSDFPGYASLYIEDEGEGQVVTFAKDLMSFLVADRESEDFSINSNQASTSSEGIAGLPSLKEPVTEKAKKKLIKLNSSFSLTSTESSDRDESLSEEEEFFGSTKSEEKKRRLGDFLRASGDLNVSKIVSELSETTAEMPARPIWNQSKIRESLSKNNEQEVTLKAKNKIENSKEDFVFYDSETLDEKIWNYLKIHLDALPKRYKWTEIPATQIEKSTSPRSRALYEKIHNSHSLLKEVVVNLILMEKHLHAFVEAEKSNTRWIKRFRNHLDKLIKSNLKDFVNHFEEVPFEDKPYILLALGSDAVANIEVLRKWANFSNEDEVRKFFINRIFFHLGRENLTEKEMNVSSVLFEGSDVFQIPRAAIVRGLMVKKICRIPHFVEEKRIKRPKQALRDDVKLKKFLILLLGRMCQGTALADLAFEENVNNFLRLELTGFDYFFRLFYLGHFKIIYAIQHIFSIGHRDVEIEYIKCYVDFKSFNEFRLKYVIDSVIGSKVQILFNINIIPIQRKVNSFEAIMKVVHYNFKENVSIDVKDSILETMINYSNSIRSYKTPPRGISFYEKPGGKNLDADFKDKLQEEIFACKDDYPCIEPFKLEDLYLKACRKIIYENHGTFSDKDVEVLKLSLNGPFFEALMPRISYLRRVLKEYSDEKRKQIPFFQALMQIFRKIDGISRYIVNEKGITNNDAEVGKFLEIVNEISDLEKRNWIFSIVGGTPEKGEALIGFLREAMEEKKIMETLQIMKEEFHKYRTKKFGSNFYQVRIPEKLQKRFFSVLPEDTIRSYRSSENAMCIFNSIKINNALLFEATDRIDLCGLLKGIYAHFDEKRSEKRIEYETQAFEEILATSWKKLLPCFFGKRKQSEGSFYKKKTMDIKQVYKIFADFPAINLEKVQDNFKNFKKKRKHTTEDLCRAISSWFVSATVPCYPLLVLGANGAWSLVETLLRATYTGFNELPFGFKLMPGIDLEIQIENAICYKVKVIKKMGVCPRIDRWNPNVTAVDNKSPLATLQMEATFSIENENLEMMLEIKPPVFHRKNFYSAEDFYRIIKIFEQASPPLELNFGVLSESKKKRKPWQLKVKDCSKESWGKSSHAFAALHESYEKEDESTST